MKQLIKDVLFIIVLAPMIPFTVLGFVLELLIDGFKVGRKLETKFMEWLVAK